MAFIRWRSSILETGGSSWPWDEKCSSPDPGPHEHLPPGCPDSSCQQENAQRRPWVSLDLSSLKTHAEWENLPPFQATQMQGLEKPEGITPTQHRSQPRFTRCDRTALQSGQKKITRKLLASSGFPVLPFQGHGSLLLRMNLPVCGRTFTQDPHCGSVHAQTSLLPARPRYCRQGLQSSPAPHKDFQVCKSLSSFLYPIHPGHLHM